MIVKLGDIARECKCTSDNKDCPIVGLEHLEPKELLLKNYSSDPNTTFTKSFKAGQILFGRRRSYQQKASVATFDGICSGECRFPGAASLRHSRWLSLERHPQSYGEPR